MVEVAGKRWLTVREFSQRHEISRNFVYELCAQGRLPCIRLGVKILIKTDALDQLLVETGRPPSAQADDA